MRFTSSVLKMMSQDSLPRLNMKSDILCWSNFLTNFVPGDCAGSNDLRDSIWAS